MTPDDGAAPARPTAAPDTSLGGVGPGPAPIYLLMFYPLIGSRAPRDAGWRVEAWHGHRPGWSIMLAGRGADAAAPPRVAQTAAARVLGEHDIGVSHWYPCGGDRTAMSLAHLRPADPLTRRPTLS